VHHPKKETIMRHKASLIILAFTLCACATIPAFIRLDVDGSTVEYKKKQEPPAGNETAGNETAGNDAAPR
jgi:starvation-inducible outer membrane lipoprotein